MRIDFHDDENDNRVISANLFLRRDILLIEFPAMDGHRLATVRIEHHNGTLNLVYWDLEVSQKGGPGTIVPLFDVERDD